MAKLLVTSSPQSNPHLAEHRALPASTGHTNRQLLAAQKSQGVGAQQAPDKTQRKEKPRERKITKESRRLGLCTTLASLYAWAKFSEINK